ncbi:MAG: hypothetical protein IJD39_05005 [Clostridia bacterium]|nr:hypothetical protein [Clostridia bacterium]
MCNKSACARYNFDLFSTTLTISKEFEKRAAIPGSIEQLTFCQLMATYGDALVVERYETHQTKKGLTFKQMEVYISKCRNADKRMTEFVTVKELSKGQTSPYKYVKTWFMANYPNYSEQPQFDANGFLIVKTKVEMETEKNVAPADEIAHNSVQEENADAHVLAKAS